MDIHSLNITFNGATEMAYEQLTNTPFDPHTLTDEDGKISTQTLVNLTTAVIIANNKEVENPAFFLYEYSRQELFDLYTKVSKALYDWLVVPSIAEAHINDAPDEKEGDTKNS